MLLGSTWLWAPQLNHFLSYRTTLISQYEAPGQPFSVFLRSGDFLAGLLLVFAALTLRKLNILNKIQWILLLIIGAGMMIDPTFATDCRWDQIACRQNLSLSFAVHASETVITAAAIFLLALYDSAKRKTFVSISFTIFQIGYGLLLLSQLAEQNHFDSLSQYIYQLLSLVWLAWFVYSYLENHTRVTLSDAKLLTIRNLVAAWAFLNGALSILVGLTHMHLISDDISSAYFAGDTAWLAQHRVIIGAVLIYLSRQLQRGELRARQIFMAISGLEIIRYSLITPQPLLWLYVFSFCLLFITKEEFYRGTVVLTWRGRLKDAGFVLASLTILAVIWLVLIDIDNRRAIVTAQAIDHFFDYTARSQIVPKSHLTSALLAHTISALLLAITAIILWVLFRPYKMPGVKLAAGESSKLKQLLARYSTSPDDYFKLWPTDKKYFWSKNKAGFIAYKSISTINFALADPIVPKKIFNSLVKDFIEHSRSRRLRACFLPVTEKILVQYEQLGLSTVQIGSIALVDINGFINTTARDKWWRWRQNKAQKSGYEYRISYPPHNHNLIKDLKSVSDSWLNLGGHKERAFAMGYFDADYFAQCKIHYLTNAQNEIVAFNNELPAVNKKDTVTIDLMRYSQQAKDSMPYLLLKTIEFYKNQGTYKYFDLGFVPFTASKDPVVNLARIVSTGKFSARGLEQFKNKFDPIWQPTYLAYDGDLGDLAMIAVNLEKVMEAPFR